MRAQRSADQIAFVWHPYHGSPREWTYRELARDAAGLAAGLQRRGIGPGDKVLIHLENCPEFVIAWYACAAVGAVAVTTNTRSAADEMRYFSADSQPAGAITQPRFAEMIAACAPHSNGRRSWIITPTTKDQHSAERLVCIAGRRSRQVQSASARSQRPR